jgi:hypothetical protein
MSQRISAASRPDRPVREGRPVAGRARRRQPAALHGMDMRRLRRFPAAQAATSSAHAACPRARGTAGAA